MESESAGQGVRIPEAPPKKYICIKLLDRKATLAVASCFVPLLWAVCNLQAVQQ